MTTGQIDFCGLSGVDVEAVDVLAVVGHIEASVGAEHQIVGPCSFPTGVSAPVVMTTSELPLKA
jgi:hypothetical protein